MSGVHDQFRGYRHPFVFGIHFLGGVGAMSMLSAEIRRIPDWWNVRLDSDVRMEWAHMARERVWSVRTPSSTVEIALSEKQIQYVLDELEGYAALYDHENSCQVSCFERIWEHTLAPSPSLSTSLTRLRHTTSASPWDTLALCTSLIDPHSHPLIYNRTLVRSSPSPRASPRLRTLPPPSGGDIYTVSSSYALLPTPVSISSTGSATFTSYINNLHPRTHAPAYSAFASLLTAFIPLFEHVLTDLHRNNPLPQRIAPSRGPRYRVWDEPEEPVHSDDEDGWAQYEAELRHWAMYRPIELPDVPREGYTGGLERRRHRVCLRGREVKVVVGVEDVRLEPGGPEYAGSQWHVEGMRNERIVAVGEYYAEIENITQPTLSFRMATTYPRCFAAGDNGATLRTWGLRDGDACHQHIGSRALSPGLLLAFPNLYQSHLSAFALADPARPGRLTLVRFGLVDPEVSGVVGTGEVAPQQEAWIREAVFDALGGNLGLPHEIVEMVMERVEGVLGEGEARECAKRLREVREVFRVKNDQYHFCIPFDVWSAPEVGAV
ncbi:hypothetical protein C0995_006809 [Termitomyces sp. Mi166|nr:hypothetical protein C0995_006809 [Termitomyces sp. Mi166\